MKHFFNRLRMYIVSECYCYEVTGDNSHCPAHGKVGYTVRFIAGFIFGVLFVAFMIAWGAMPQ